MMLNPDDTIFAGYLLQGFAGVLLFRFLMQWLRAPMRNPLGEFIMAISNFAVLRARRFIPPVWGLDSSSLLLALLVECAYLGLTLSLDGYPFVHFPLFGLLALSAVKLRQNKRLPADECADCASDPVLGQSLYAAGPLLAAITYRFLRPLQRILPLVGNIDLSPLLLLVICQIILLVPIAMLESLAARLL